MAVAEERLQILVPKQLKRRLAEEARRVFARLIGFFANWLRYGSEPEPEICADFSVFRDWALARLKKPGLLTPLHYRSVLEMFADARPKRQADIWRRYLGPRYMLDRQLLALNILQKNWKEFKNNLKYLPRYLIASKNLEGAFAKLKEKDPFAENNAIHLFRKFMSEDADLKSAMITADSQIVIELENLRTQSESLGRSMRYDQVADAMIRRQISQVQEKRNKANQHIDHYLIGFLHALDKNYPAAVSAFSMCLIPEKKMKKPESGLPPLETAVDAEWFKKALPPRERKFDKTRVAGLDAEGTVGNEFVYFNLGQMHMKLGHNIEAGMCFSGFINKAAKDKWHLYGKWAEELLSSINNTP